MSVRTIPLLLVVLAGGLLAAADPAPVPPSVATTLRAAQAEADPEKAAALLQAHPGPAHALIDAALGNARWRQAEATTDLSAQRDLRAQAERSWKQATERDAQCRPAWLGLARSAAARDDWAGAVRSFAPAWDAGSATVSETVFYAQAARNAGDRALTETLVRHGMMRFPDEIALRRLHAALLVDAARWSEAEPVVRDLLDRTGPDADLLRMLAWCARQRGDTDAGLTALEAATIVAPDDHALRAQFAQAQLAAGQPRAALATFAALVGRAEAATPALLQTAATAAAEAGDVALGRQWLERVPAAHRDRSYLLLAARLALKGDDPAAAAAALEAVIAQGESDPRVLVWAGQVAEQRGDDARAEALYQQAIAADRAASAPAATLRLAALYLRQGRRSEAATLVAAYRAKHPDDAAAAALARALAGAAGG